MAADLYECLGYIIALIVFVLPAWVATGKWPNHAGAIGIWTIIVTIVFIGWWQMRVRKANG